MKSLRVAQATGGRERSVRAAPVTEDVTWASRHDIDVQRRRRRRALDTRWAWMCRQSMAGLQVLQLHP